MLKWAVRWQGHITYPLATLKSLVNVSKDKLQTWFSTARIFEWKYVLCVNLMNSSRSVILITNWTHQVITRHIFLQVIRVGSFVFQRVIKTTAYNRTVMSYSNTIITATTIKSYSKTNRIIDNPLYYFNYFNYLFQLPSCSITLFECFKNIFPLDWVISLVMRHFQKWLWLRLRSIKFRAGSYRYGLPGWYFITSFLHFHDLHLNGPQIER